MNQCPPWYEMVDRAQNFRWDTERLKREADKNAEHYDNLLRLKEKIIETGHKLGSTGYGNGEILENVFAELYNSLASRQELGYELFCRNKALKDDVYQVCKFFTLSSFLNSSKRITGKSLRDFVFDNHPLKFYALDSPNYHSPSLLLSEMDRLRKARNRLLQSNDVYYQNSQWQAMPKDAEHEWTFYYAIDDADESVKDAFKRIRNLYNNIEKAVTNDKNDEYQTKLKEAYKKFRSKLRKLKYENFLDMQKTVLAHIKNNKDYYGMNIYRLERRLRPYIISNEVENLLACQSLDDECVFLAKTIILKNIEFPKLYTDFASLPFSAMYLCATEFPAFLQDIAVSSCLILDALVEKGVFGENWENVFLDIVNEMVENVFYSPNKIDFTIAPGSQEKFEELLLSPVLEVLCYEGNMCPSDFGEIELNELFDIFCCE